MDRKRLIILFAAAIVSIAALEARLFYLQIVKFGEYEDYRKARSHIELLQPRRGRILDRNGRILARDDRDFALDVVLEEFEENGETRARLERLLGEPLDDSLARIASRIEFLAAARPESERRAILRRERRTPYPLVASLRFVHAFEIDANADFYPGLVVRERLRRVYPEGADAAHVTGYLGKLRKGEVDQLDLSEFTEALGPDGVALLQARGAFQETLVGRDGVERSYDSVLRGRPGLLLRERPAGGKKEVRMELLAAQAGQDVRLTIDLDVQKRVRAAMAGHPGSAIVIDPNDGAILALVNEPAFDPNDFIPPARPERLSGYFAPEANNPLLDRAVAGRFNLGSVFKIVTASAALEEGVASKDRVITCNGKFSERYVNLNCWIYNEHGTTHGPLSLPGALERSCNIYFYTLGSELGIPRLNGYGRRFGFGDATGVDLPGEKKGFMPFGGTEGEAAQFGIGQAQFLATPIQVATMICVVANGGDVVTPHLIADAGPARRPAGISPATLDVVREGLGRVVSGPEGTGRNPILQRLQVAGKTGTAQTPGGSGRHAWFAGYFPKDAPKYAIVVLMEHAGGSGGHVAAPMAAQIAEALP